MTGWTVLQKSFIPEEDNKDWCVRLCLSYHSWISVSVNSVLASRSCRSSGFSLLWPFPIAHVEFKIRRFNWYHLICLKQFSGLRDDEIWWLWCATWCSYSLLLFLLFFFNSTATLTLSSLWVVTSERKIIIDAFRNDDW